MSDEVMININGGASTVLNGNLLSSIVRIFNTVLEIGRSIGSALYSFKTGRKC